MTQRLKHQLGASISSPAQDFETLPQDARSSFTTAAVCCEPQGSPNDLWLSPAPQRRGAALRTNLRSRVVASRPSDLADCGAA